MTFVCLVAPVVVPVVVPGVAPAVVPVGSGLQCCPGR